MKESVQQNLDFSPDICEKKHKGNEFSRNAHRSIKPSKSQLLKLVLNFISSRGLWGATCEEIEVALSLTHQTASARCAELKAKNLITVRGTRKTQSGRNAGVLVKI